MALKRDGSQNGSYGSLKGNFTEIMGRKTTFQ